LASNVVKVMQNWKALHFVLIQLHLCDFDLDLDLDMLKMYLCTKSEVCMSRLSKVRAQTGQTPRQTRL